MNNIPKGYDENGVRSGNGKWIKEVDNEDMDKDIDDIVKCERCGAIEDREFANVVRAGDETHYYCEQCASELGLI